METNIVAWSYHMMLCKPLTFTFSRCWYQMVHSTAVLLKCFPPPGPSLPLLWSLVSPTPPSLLLCLWTRHMFHCLRSTLRCVCARAYIWTADHWNILPLRTCPSVMNFSGFWKRRVSPGYILTENTPTDHHTAMCPIYPTILALALAVTAVAVSCHGPAYTITANSASLYLLDPLLSLYFLSNALPFDI